MRLNLKFIFITLPSFRILNSRIVTEFTFSKITYHVWSNKYLDIILILEKLLTSEGRELRRSLFSLKQIFQDDKDLVHGFVALGGLNSLVRVGSGADQNYQNYILRALGQVKILIVE